MNFLPKAIRWLVLFTLIAVGVRVWLATGEVRRPAGVLVPADPIQTTCSGVALPQVAGYALTALASYHLAGRVLHTKRYYGAVSDLVPIDVALGWGRMSDSAVLSLVTISQGNRFYYYDWRSGPPIPKNEIVSPSANNHVIAANRQVVAFFRSLKPGHLVDLRGYLVVASKNGFTWRSSLTRTDSGNGACELYYVTEAKMLDGNPFPESAATTGPLIHSLPGLHKTF